MNNVMNKTVFCWLCTVVFSTGAFAQSSRVSVKGNHFITADGQTIVFRGLDTSDPDKLERNGQWNKHYFEVAKSWGANVVRIPVHPAAWHIHGKKNYLRLLDQGVAWANEEGLYVIIDWHSIGNLHEEKFFPGLVGALSAESLQHHAERRRWISGGRWPDIFAATTPSPFLNCSTSRRSTPDLKIGTCTWPEWKGLMEEIIKTIRANGGTAVPLVAGFNFGYDLTPWPARPINAEGIGYVAHPYPMKAKQPWDDELDARLGICRRQISDDPDRNRIFGAGSAPGGYNPITGDESYGDAHHVLLRQTRNFLHRLVF